MSAREPHRAREMAESFGVDAERYDRSRPRYPDALFERILNAGPGRDVLDVGCGTGIAARQLQAAGATVLGVEPDARMAGFARRHGTDVEVATFETWEPAGRDFDIVVAGQSWHWVDPVAGADKAARVLRPGGLLAVIRNDGQIPPAVADAVAGVYRRLLPGTFAADAVTRSAADTYTVQTAGTVDGIRQTGRFGEPDRWSVTWEQHVDNDDWLDLLPTSDGHTLLPAAELAEVLSTLRTALHALGPGFTIQYVTTVFAATRSR
ncbi:class I SAM-dependent methyltransferase [Actinoplanes siamensis]|uniref:class I SAM-dependent methyltransferase n=1 Tax=Actinoplanes siamensis TaxID=1223317 RepID=UPI001EF1D81E|nr:class I SAM-dependent methyltransferase [Actinoplanes siamensis]